MQFQYRIYEKVLVSTKDEKVFESSRVAVVEPHLLILYKLYHESQS